MVGAAWKGDLQECVCRRKLERRRRSERWAGQDVLESPENSVCVRGEGEREREMLRGSERYVIGQCVRIFS